MAEPAAVYHLPVPPREVQEKRGPQVEDGYTRIANELLEVVINSQTCPVTLRQLRVVMAVIRKTYGFNKKVDRISDGQLAAETGMSRQNVNTAKRELLAMGVLLMDGHKIGVNKHHQEWDFSAKPEKDNLRQTRDSVSKPETKSVSKNGSHKRQKDILSTDVERSAPQRRNSLDFSEFTDRVDLETLKAFADHRKALRKPMTQRALKGVVKGAVQAAEALGLSAEQCLDEAMASGWLKVETEWLRNRGYGQSANDNGAPACPHAEILAKWDEHLGAKRGKAPAVVDWQGTRMAGKLEALWRKYWMAPRADGGVRYDSVESGIAWWGMAFEKLAGSRNFLQSDVNLSNLFNPDTFTLAAQGKLREQGGAVR